MPEPDYARIAYEAYAEAIKWTQYVNDPADPTRVLIVALSRWRDVPRDRQDAWQAAIDAAFNAQIPGDAP